MKSNVGHAEQVGTENNTVSSTWLTTAPVKSLQAAERVASIPPLIRWLIYHQPQKNVKTGRIPTGQDAYQAMATLGGLYDSTHTEKASWETIWNDWSTLKMNTDSSQS